MQKLRQTASTHTLLVSTLLFVLALTSGMLWGCSTGEGTNPETSTPIEQEQTDKAPSSDESTGSNESEAAPATDDEQKPKPQANAQAQTFTADDIPAYTGSYYVPINDNIPFFSKKDLVVRDLESYSPLDSLGRCGVAISCIGTETMPTEERKSIGDVHPSGWVMKKYDFVDGKYLYNRCHLIGFQLAGENANERNLITGTRSFNVQGMLPFENMVADYVDQTGAHVLYRVTPIYEGDDLVARGVLMEARSIEDSGAGVCFNVFVYNVEPGVVIDYATGDNHADNKNSSSASSNSNSSNSSNAQHNSSSQQSPKMTYVLNTSSHKFHYPECSSVDGMNEENKKEVKDTREHLIEQGYEPCGRCNP